MNPRNFIKSVLIDIVCSIFLCTSLLHATTEDCQEIFTEAEQSLQIVKDFSLRLSNSKIDNSLAEKIQKIKQIISDVIYAREWRDKVLKMETISQKYNELNALLLDLENAPNLFLVFAGSDNDVLNNLIEFIQSLPYSYSALSPNDFTFRWIRYQLSLDRKTSQEEFEAVFELNQLIKNYDSKTDTDLLPMIALKSLMSDDFLLGIELNQTVKNVLDGTQNSFASIYFTQLLYIRYKLAPLLYRNTSEIDQNEWELINTTFKKILETENEILKRFSMDQEDYFKVIDFFTVFGGDNFKAQEHLRDLLEKVVVLSLNQNIALDPEQPFFQWLTKKFQINKKDPFFKINMIDPYDQINLSIPLFQMIRFQQNTLNLLSSILVTNSKSKLSNNKNPQLMYYLILISCFSEESILFLKNSPNFVIKNRLKPISNIFIDRINKLTRDDKFKIPLQKFQDRFLDRYNYKDPDLYSITNQDLMEQFTKMRELINSDTLKKSNTPDLPQEVASICLILQSIINMGFLPINLSNSNESLSYLGYDILFIGHGVYPDSEKYLINCLEIKSSLASAKKTRMSWNEKRVSLKINKKHRATPVWHQFILIKGLAPILNESAQQHDNLEVLWPILNYDNTELLENVDGSIFFYSQKQNQYSNSPLINTEVVNKILSSSDDDSIKTPLFKVIGTLIDMIKTHSSSFTTM